MIRAVDLAEISDGRRYTNNDLVKTDTGGCKNCSRCCHGMTETIFLDPWDMYHLQMELKKTFSDLMAGSIELGMADGIILPHLSAAQGSDACVFLSDAGRCQIHAARPGFCRLFPLGRVYEKDTFYYFIQIHECPQTRTKVKVRKWLGIPDLQQYEQFVQIWHDLQQSARERARENDSARQKICMQILEIFYQTPWNRNRDFYTQFADRVSVFQKTY